MFAPESKLIAIIAIALAACAPLAPHSDDTALIDQLRRGGYVIFFRHALTDWRQPDSAANLDDCATQRNLSDAGRAQARSIGQAMDKLQIPVGDVLTSPFCRAYETGVLAFGRARRVEDLTGVQSTPPELRARRAAALRTLFSTPPPPGTNTVVVAHMYNLSSVVDVLIGEGDAAVMRPRADGGGGFDMVATMNAARWSELADAPGPARASAGN